MSGVCVHACHVLPPQRIESITLADVYLSFTLRVLVSLLSLVRVPLSFILFLYQLSTTINIINDQCMHTLFPGMCTFTTRKIKRSGTAMTNPVAQMDTKMDLSIKKRRIRARESGGGREKERANKVNIRVNTGGVGGATELLVCALCVQAQSAQLTVCVPNVADQRPMHSPCHVRDSKRGRCRLRAADADERAVSGRQAKHARLRRAARH